MINGFFKHIFVVHVNKLYGEHSFKSVHLICAPSKKLAADYAICSEAVQSEKLVWSTDSAMEFNGDFGYTSRVEEIETRYLPALKKVFNLEDIDYQELYNSGNYGQCVSLEDYTLSVVGLFDINNVIDDNKKFQNQYQSHIQTSFNDGVSIFDLVESLASIHQQPKDKLTQEDKDELELAGRVATALQQSTYVSLNQMTYLVRKIDPEQFIIKSKDNVVGLFKDNCLVMTAWDGKEENFSFDEILQAAKSGDLQLRSLQPVEFN